jgi:hypothetical protein
MERAMLGWVVAILVVVVVVVVPGSFYLGYVGGEVADYLGWVPGLEHLVSEVIGGVAVGWGARRLFRWLRRETDAQPMHEHGDPAL